MPGAPNKGDQQFQKIKEAVINKVWAYNTKRGEPISYEELSSIIRVQTRNSGVLLPVEHLTELIHLPGNGYVVKKREPILKTISNIDYNLQYPSANTNEKVLKNQKFQLNAEISELDKIKIEGPELFTLMGKHPSCLRMPPM